MPDIDHFAGNPAEFPVLARRIHLNHCGVSPLPARAAAAMSRYAAESSAGIAAPDWYRCTDDCRANAAMLLGASPDEIALVTNTSEGLSIVANGIDWRPGDEVVVAAHEYPSNQYPWMALAPRGVVTIRVPPTTRPDGAIVVTEDQLLAAVTPRTRLLAVSSAQWATGQRMNLATLGEFCHARGILFCVDAIQTLGVIPLHPKAIHADFVCASGHKWMLGPQGTGILYVAKSRLPELALHHVGWNSVKHALRYEHVELDLRQTAAKFEPGTHNYAGFMALGASLAMINQIGVDAIARSTRDLTDRLVAGLHAKRYTVVGPRDDHAWSGIVSFHRAGVDPKATVKLLAERDIVLVIRDGRLRAGPAFYNTPAQIDALLDALP